MRLFQPTSSFKQDSGFHKDGLGSNHPSFPCPLFQPGTTVVTKIYDWFEKMYSLVVHSLEKV